LEQKETAFSDSPEQFGQRNPQGPGDFLDVNQGNVPLSAFDSTDVSTIQAADVCKLLLRHPELVTSSPDSLAKAESDVPCRHGGSYLGTWPLICPRTISIIQQKQQKMANFIDKPDEFLQRLRGAHPVLGWSVTVLAMPVALALGLGLLALILVLGPAIPIVGAVWLVLFAALSAIGRYREEYKPDRMLNGADRSVILALGIVISILVIVVIVQLPNGWVKHIFRISD
jgi:hypothetical protein